MYDKPSTHRQTCEALNDERNHQLKKWGPAGASGTESRHTVAEYILYAQDYADEALAQATTGTAEAQHTLRKVAAILLACLERHVHNGDRGSIFLILEEIDIPKKFEPVLTQSDFRFDLLHLTEGLRRARASVSRTHGDEGALNILGDAMKSAYELMRYYGSPTRESASSQMRYVIHADMAAGETPTPQHPPLKRIDLSTELWRQYIWTDPADGKTQSAVFDNPIAVYLYKGCTTHRVVCKDSDGVEIGALVPAIGYYGCSVRFAAKPGQQLIVA